LRGEDSEMVESNPFVDVAAFLFLEDIADKQGEAGMSNYLISLASSLAKSMPEEEYDTWDDFQTALRNSESILTSFDKVITPTDNALVCTMCPYESAILEYTRRVGELSQQHFDVAEYYNNTIKPGALNTCCVIHQSYWTFASERIKVGGKRIRYAHISSANILGQRKRAPEEWLPILLEKAGLTLTKLNMLQRNNATIWCVYMAE
jgi:hypothetical protein